MKRTRRFPRVPFRNRIYCTGRGKFFSDLAANLSEGGVGLETISRLEPGDEVEIEFRLPGTDEGFCIRSEVVWVKPVSEAERTYGAGLAFDDLTRNERLTIRRFIADRLTAENETEET